MESCATITGVEGVGFVSVRYDFVYAEQGLHAPKNIRALKRPSRSVL